VSEHIILYDAKLRRPGCVLLAACAGTTGAERRFPSESWLTFPTDDLKRYRIAEDQLQVLVADAQRRAKAGEFREPAAARSEDDER